MDLEFPTITPTAQPVDFSSSPSLETSESKPNSSIINEAKEVFPVYKEWQQKHQEELAAKKVKSEQEVEKMKKEAEEYLAQESANRTQINQKRKEANMEAEKKFKDSRDQTLAQGNDWERVSTLCDLSKRMPETSRMREVLQVMSK